MKWLFVLAALAGIAMAQRPSYAGSAPIGRPGLASRFQETNAESTTANLANRVGEGSTDRIPVDARGDNDLVDRLNQWPREHRPFWLLNAEHIEASRNPSKNEQTLEQRGTFNNDETIPVRPANPRSSFLSPIN